MVYVLSHCLWPRPWSQTAEKLSLFLSTSIFHIPEWVHQKAIATFQLQVTSSITSILSFLVPFRLFYKLKLSFTLCEHTGLVSLLGFVWRQFCLTAYRFWYKKKISFKTHSATYKNTLFCLYGQVSICFQLVFSLTDFQTLTMQSNRYTINEPRTAGTTEINEHYQPIIKI